MRREHAHGAEGHHQAHEGMQPSVSPGTNGEHDHAHHPSFPLWTDLGVCRWPGRTRAKTLLSPTVWAPWGVQIGSKVLMSTEQEGPVASQRHGCRSRLCISSAGTQWRRSISPSRRKAPNLTMDTCGAGKSLMLDHDRPSTALADGSCWMGPTTTLVLAARDTGDAGRVLQTAQTWRDHRHSGRSRTGRRRLSTCQRRCRRTRVEGR